MLAGFSSGFDPLAAAFLRARDACDALDAQDMFRGKLQRLLVAVEPELQKARHKRKARAPSFRECGIHRARDVTTPGSLRDVALTAAEELVGLAWSPMSDAEKRLKRHKTAPAAGARPNPRLP